MSRNVYDSTTGTLTPIAGCAGVDSAFNSTSQNALENRVITNAMGTLADLTTDSKTNLVGAINEVDAHADTNASNITLTQQTVAYINTNSTTASKAYAAGEQFILDGVLRKAKTAITSGATLTLNSNYENASSVTSQISNLKSGKVDIKYGVVIEAADDKDSFIDALAATIRYNSATWGYLDGTTFAVSGYHTYNGTTMTGYVAIVDKRSTGLDIILSYFMDLFYINYVYGVDLYKYSLKNNVKPWESIVNHGFSATDSLAVNKNITKYSEILIEFGISNPPNYIQTAVLPLAEVTLEKFILFSTYASATYNYEVALRLQNVTSSGFSLNIGQCNHGSGYSAFSVTIYGR